MSEDFGWKSLLLPLRANNVYVVFFKFISRPSCEHSLLNAVVTFWILACTDALFQCVHQMTTSSAKRAIFTLLVPEVKFVTASKYNANRIGERTLPWGTRHSMFENCDNDLFTLIVTLLLLRKSWIQDIK